MDETENGPTVTEPTPAAPSANQYYVLNKSFAQFSSGTQFEIRDVIGGTVARCTTRYPIIDLNSNRGGVSTKPRYVRADIPMKYLTPKRARGG